MKEWIEPCQQLLEQYRSGELGHTLTSCTLCLIVEPMKAPDLCNSCIWVRMTGKCCHDYAGEVFPDIRRQEISQTAVMYHDEWKRFRIQQLHSWINQLKYWRG